MRRMMLVETAGGRPQANRVRHSQCPGDEQLGHHDVFVLHRVVFTHPELSEPEPFAMLHQLEIFVDALGDRLGRGMVRHDEHAVVDVRNGRTGHREHPEMCGRSGVNAKRDATGRDGGSQLFREQVAWRRCHGFPARALFFERPVKQSSETAAPSRFVCERRKPAYKTRPVRCRQPVTTETEPAWTADKGVAQYETRADRGADGCHWRCKPIRSDQDPIHSMWMGSDATVSRVASSHRSHSQSGQAGWSLVDRRVAPTCRLATDALHSLRNAEMIGLRTTRLTARSSVLRKDCHGVSASRGISRTVSCCSIASPAGH